MAGTFDSSNLLYVTKEYEEDIKNKAKQIYADDEVSIKLETINKQLNELLTELDTKLTFITNKMTGDDGVEAYVQGAHTQIDRVNIDQENMVDEGVRNTTSHPSVNAFKNNRTETKFLSQDFINQSIALTSKNRELFINGTGKLSDNDTLHTFSFNLCDEECLKIVEFAITYKQIPNIIHMNEDKSVDKESTVTISRVLTGRFFIIRHDPVNNPTECIVKAIVENSDNTGNIIDRKIVNVEEGFDGNLPVILDDGPQFDLYFKIIDKSKLDIYIGKIVPYRYVVQKDYASRSTGEIDPKSKTCTMITGYEPSKPKSFDVDEVYYSNNLNTAFCVDRTNKRIGYFYFTETVTESAKKLLDMDSRIQYDGSEILDFWVKDFGYYTLIRIKTETINTTYIASRNIDSAIDLGKDYDDAFILSTEELILKRGKYFYYFDAENNVVSMDTFYIINDTDTASTFEKNGTIIELENKYAIIFYTSSDKVCYRVKTKDESSDSYKMSTVISPENILEYFPTARIQNISATTSTIHTAKAVDGIYVYATYIGTNGKESLVYCLNNFVVNDSEYKFKSENFPRYFNTKTKTFADMITPSPIKIIKPTNIFNFAITEDEKVYLIDEAHVVDAVSFTEVSDGQWTDENGVLKLKRNKDESEYFVKNNAYLQNVLAVGNGLDGIHIIDRKGIYRVSSDKTLECIYLADDNGEIYGSITGPYNVEYATVRINENVKKYFYVRTVPYYLREEQEKLKTKYLDLFSNDYQLYDENIGQYKVNTPIIEFKALMYVSFVDHMSTIYNTDKTNFIHYNKVVDLASVKNGKEFKIVLSTNKYGFVKNDLILTGLNTNEVEALNVLMDPNVSDINIVKRYNILKRPNDSVTYDKAIDAIHELVKKHHESAVSQASTQDTGKYFVPTADKAKVAVKALEDTTSCIIASFKTKYGRFVLRSGLDKYFDEFTDLIQINATHGSLLDPDGIRYPEFALLENDRHSTFAVVNGNVCKDNAIDENGEIYKRVESQVTYHDIFSEDRALPVTVSENGNPTSNLKGIGSSENCSNPLFIGTPDAENKYSILYEYNSNTEEFETTDALSRVGLVLATNTLFNGEDKEYHIIAGETISAEIPPEPDESRPIVYKIIGKDRNEIVELSDTTKKLHVSDIKRIQFYNFDCVKLMRINGDIYKFNENTRKYEFSISFNDFAGMTPFMFINDYQISECNSRIFVTLNRSMDPSAKTFVFEYDYVNNMVENIYSAPSLGIPHFGEGFVDTNDKYVDVEDANNASKVISSPIVYSGNLKIYPLGKNIEKFKTIGKEVSVLTSPQIWRDVEINGKTYKDYDLYSVKTNTNGTPIYHKVGTETSDDNIIGDGVKFKYDFINGNYVITKDAEPIVDGDAEKQYYLFDLSKASFSKLHTITDFNSTANIRKYNKIYRVVKKFNSDFTEINTNYVKSPIPGFEYYKMDLSGTHIKQNNLKQFSRSVYFCPTYEITLIDPDTTTYAEATRAPDAAEDTFVGLYVLCEPSFRLATNDDFGKRLDDDNITEIKTFKDDLVYYEEHPMNIEGTIMGESLKLSTCGEYMRYHFGSDVYNNELKDEENGLITLKQVLLNDTTSLVKWDDNTLTSESNPDVLYTGRTIYPIIRYWKTTNATFALFVSNVGTKFATIFCRCSDDFKTIYEEYFVTNYGDTADQIVNLYNTEYDRYEVTETSVGTFIVNTNASSVESKTYIFDNNTLSLKVLNVSNDVPYIHIIEFEDGNIYALKKGDTTLKVYKFDNEVTHAFGVDPEFEFDDLAPHNVLKRLNKKTGRTEVYFTIISGKWGLYVLKDNALSKVDNLSAGFIPYNAFIVENRYLCMLAEGAYSSRVYDLDSNELSHMTHAFITPLNSENIVAYDVGNDFINEIVPNYHPTEFKVALSNVAGNESSAIYEFYDKKEVDIKASDIGLTSDDIYPDTDATFIDVKQNCLPVQDGNGNVYFSYAKANMDNLKPDPSKTYTIRKHDDTQIEKVNFDKLFFSSKGLIGVLDYKLYIADILDGSLVFNEVISSDNTPINHLVQNPNTYLDTLKLYERNGTTFLLSENNNVVIIRETDEHYYEYIRVNPGLVPTVGKVYFIISEKGNLDKHTLIYTAATTEAGLEVETLTKDLVWINQDTVDTVTTETYGHETLYGITIFVPALTNGRVRNSSIKEWLTFKGLPVEGNTTTPKPRSSRSIVQSPIDGTVYLGMSYVESNTVKWCTYRKERDSDYFELCNNSKCITGITKVENANGNSAYVVSSISTSTETGDQNQPSLFIQKYNAFDGNETETLVNVSLGAGRFPSVANIYDIYQFAISSCPAGYGLDFASVRFNIDYGQIFCVRLNEDGIIDSSADIDTFVSGTVLTAIPESKYIYGNSFFTMKLPFHSTDSYPKGIFSSVKQGLVATKATGGHNEGKYTGYAYTFIGKTKKIFNNERLDVTQTLKDKYTVKCVGLYSEDEGFIEKFYDNNSYVTDQTAINDKMSLEEFYKKIYFDNFSKNKNNTLYPRKDSIKSNNFVTSVIPLKDTRIFDNGYFNIDLCVFPGRLKDSAKDNKLDILKSWNGSFFRNHNPSLPFDPYSNNGGGR